MIVPSQLIIYLGVELTLITMRAHPSQLRREALTSLLQRVKTHRSVTALLIMRLLGMMLAAHIVILLFFLICDACRDGSVISASIPCITNKV